MPQRFKKSYIPDANGESDVEGATKADF